MGFVRRGFLGAIAVCVVGAAMGVSPAHAAYDQNFGFSWSPSQPANALARVGDRLYVGGDFTAFLHPVSGRTTRQRVAALDATTGTPLAGFSPSVNGQVWAIAVGPDGTVYVGGEFSEVNGQPAQHLAALTPSGELVPGFRADTNDTVYDLIARSGGLYAAGAFGQVNGSRRGGLVKLDRLTGAVDLGFDAQMTGGRARALTAVGDDVVVGGSFDALSGAARQTLGSVDPDTGAVTGWNPPAVCAACPILDLSSGEGRVVAATAGLGGWAASWSASSGARQWMKRGDGDVQAIDIQDGIVYAGGHFGPTFDRQNRHQLAALSADSGTLLPYRVAFDGADKPGIWAVLADPDRMFLAGAFRLQGTSQARFAVFDSVGDANAPGSPTNVVGRVDGGDVVVEWAAPADDGGSPIQRYEVTAQPASGNASVVCSTTSTACVLPIGDDLTAGSVYTFSVRASNAVGTSAPSSPSPAVTIQDGPSGITALGPVWSTELDNRAEYGWAPVGTSGPVTYEYQVRVAKRGKSFRSWHDRPATDQQQVSLRIAPGVTKCVRARSVDSTGNRTGFTRTACRSAPVDDSALSSRGAVVRRTDGSAFRGTVSRIKTKKSALTATRVKGSRAELVATQCPACGAVRVFYDGRRVAKISTKGVRRSQVIFALPNVRAVSTVQFRPTGRGRVMIDGLSVRAR